MRASARARDKLTHIPNKQRNTPRQRTHRQTHMVALPSTAHCITLQMWIEIGRQNMRKWYVVFCSSLIPLVLALWFFGITIYYIVVRSSSSFVCSRLHRFICSLTNLYIRFAFVMLLVCFVAFFPLSLMRGILLLSFCVLFFIIFLWLYIHDSNWNCLPDFLWILLLLAFCVQCYLLLLLFFLSFFRVLMSFSVWSFSVLLLLFCAEIRF